MSQDFIKALEYEWSKLAKEPVKILEIKGGYFAFGSELATLRLFSYFSKHSKNATRIDYGYSENMSSFYFMREPI